MSDDLVKQMNDARDFPVNTCEASCHAAMIAEALCWGEDYPMLAEEPDHCGGSIAATVGALWECRTKLAQQDDLVQAAVAAALREAATLCANMSTADLQADSPTYEQGYSDGAGACHYEILASITTDAQAALDRVVVQAKKEGFEAGMGTAMKIVTSIGYGKNRDVDEGHYEAFRAIAKHYADWKDAAIRKGGE